jgi:hypothetical protein
MKIRNLTDIRSRGVILSQISKDELYHGLDREAIEKKAIRDEINRFYGEYSLSASGSSVE